MDDYGREILGWHRLQEDLRIAEQQRLIRLAEGLGQRGISLWLKFAKALASGTLGRGDLERSSPDASRTSKVPGL